MPVSDTDPRGKLVALALWYARLGVPTFPCSAKGAPLTRSGFKDATTSEDEIKTWRLLDNFALLGRPTGGSLLVIDLDIKGGKNGILEWQLLEEAYGDAPNSLTAETKSGGLHLYYRIPPGVTLKSMSGQLMLPSGAKAAGVDSRAEGGYVIVPGSPGYSWNDMESLDEVEAAMRDLQEAPAWVIGMLEKKTEVPPHEAEVPPQAPRNRVVDLVSAVIAGDNLHDSTRDLIAKLAACHSHDGHILEIVRGVMMVSRARGIRPQDWQDRFGDLPRLLAGAREKFGRPDDPDEPQGDEETDIWAEPVDMETLLATEAPEFDWVVEDRIQRGRGVIVTGLGGSSKTRFLYHLAVGLAIGRLPWDWKIKKTGKTVLVVTEDTAEDVHRLIRYTADGLTEEERAAVAEKVVVYPTAGTNVKLLARIGGVMLPTAQAEALEAKIKQIGDVALVAIDPALGITEGDEMDQSHQRALGQFADNLGVRTNAGVMLATHAAKGLTNAEEINSHSSRGAGALTDAVRGEFVLRTMTDEEARRCNITDREEQKRMVQLLATKGNHLPPAAYVPVWLRRGTNGVLEASDLEVPAAVPTEALTAAETQALEALEDMCLHHIPTMREWQDKLEARGLIPPEGPAESRRKMMQRIKNKLRDAGKIQSGMGRYTWMPVPKDPVSDNGEG